MSGLRTAAGLLDAERLRALCLERGADDAGFASVADPALADERPHVERLRPRAKSLISLVAATRREDIRNPARSVSNNEFHQATDELNRTARAIVAELEKIGVGAVNPAAGFPMEADRWGGRTWVVSHKPVAVAAGLGRMGIHRNVIHPRFGSFVLLATIVVDAEVSAYGRPLDGNPCVECKLCVAACPVGAIKPDGRFDFSACYTHNYREFMGGFGSWIESVADSRDRFDYRRRVGDAETVSMWQSLAFGPNYKAAYCVSVCPAGTDVIGPYLASKSAFLDEVVKPLQEKEEAVFVRSGSDAEAYVKARFPRKRARLVPPALRPASVDGFLRVLPLAFQIGAAGTLRARYHFEFVGDEALEATVAIDAGRLEVAREKVGSADLTIRVDAAAWLRFLAKEDGALKLLLTRRLRLRGNPRLLADFGRCFGG